MNRRYLQGRAIGNFLTCLMLAGVGTLFAGDTVRPGLEPLAQQLIIEQQDENRLVQAIKKPLLMGLNVAKPLQKWFDGRLLDQQGKHREAIQAWQEGQKSMENLTPLPKPAWKAAPDATLTVLETYKLDPKTQRQLEIVHWKVDGLRQYGVVIAPQNPAPQDRYPVILYAHGAAFGVPDGFLDWLVRLSQRGYVIVAPAMRGEPLFQSDIPIKGKLRTCEGEIENLEGEVDDCLSMLSGIWKRPYVKKNQFAMVGHSFGAGVGILTAARAGQQCKAVVSYDAWLVSPQRFYWDRMARNANNWLSWEDFCNQPVERQLAGLMTRSAVHHADKLSAQLLFFIGGAYEGSVFHLSHQDLLAELKRLGKPYAYKVMPHAGHNFVLYTRSQPARAALQLQNAFLDRHFPPLTAPVR